MNGKTYIIPSGVAEQWRAMRSKRERKEFAAWLVERLVEGTQSVDCKVHPAVAVAAENEIARVEEIRQKRSDAGSKGGRPQKANGKQTESKTEADGEQTESKAEATETIGKGKGKGSIRERERIRMKKR